MWINMQTEPDNPPYELDQFFSTKGVLLNSTGHATVTENLFRVCPQRFRRGNFPPAIVFFSPSAGFTYEGLTDALFNREISLAT
jgi:hypothetical protein